MKAALVCLLVFLVGAFAAPNVPGGRILGGGTAERGQIPYQASIQYCLQGKCQHACGGAIIGSLWVVSAAHCITGAPGLGSYQVIAGILNLDDSTANKQRIRVSYAIINPNYQGGLNPHDVAIFRLVEPLTFNDEVQPINLPEPDEVYEGEGIISGWGSVTGTEVPSMPTALQFVIAPVIASETCKTALDSLLGGSPHPLDLESNLCTGPLTGGVSICTGDPGNPVSDSNGQTLVGIASWFVTPCGRVGAPSVHVRISHYTRWIRSSISV